MDIAQCANKFFGFCSCRAHTHFAKTLAKRLYVFWIIYIYKFYSLNNVGYDCLTIIIMAYFQWSYNGKERMKRKRKCNRT